jgi:N-carbamoyl-L-amino-acid hydrolase
MNQPDLPEPDHRLAEQLFAALQASSFDGVGITRASYGAGEQAAHQLLREQAERAGLEVATDAALNLYITLPGRSRELARVMTGSHLDSVPRGGNFDGAAGVVAGLAVLSGWRQAGYQPQRDVTLMAVRAEESAWFPVSYVGSKAAFGLLPATALQACRADNGISLEQHLLQLGGDPQAIGAGQSYLQAERIDSFVEVHIEQGPVLVDAGKALGIVSGICGSLRYRHARAIGNYAHSGATPRSHRHDAVVVVSQLVIALQDLWQRLEGEGHELTVTVGQFQTDRQQADFSKVSGQVEFCIDLRSRNLETLRLMNEHLLQAVAQISAEHGVRFELGEQSGSVPGVLAQPLVERLRSAAERLGYSSLGMPSGAGHDAALFAGQGVDTAMLFIRNANGSHNPDEAMALEDFHAATCVLSQVLAERSAQI